MIGHGAVHCFGRFNEMIRELVDGRRANLYPRHESRALSVISEAFV